MRAKLLRTAIEKLQPRDKPFDVYDTMLAGFALRVQPGGAKTYIVRYRPKGGGRAVNPRTFTLGRYPALTPEQARDKAREILAAVAAGNDPAERIDPVRTVGAILDAYLRYLEGRASHRIAKGDIANHIRPAFGHLLPREVTTRRMREFSQRLEDAGKARRAGSCISIMRAAFKRAGIECPALHDVKATTWNHRDRAATREELAAVLGACRDMLAEGDGWPWSVYLILLLILSGARPSEIRTARLDEIDLERGLLVRAEHKTARKSRKPREIELSPAACEIVRRMPRIYGSPYLIPGRRKGEPLQEYASAWRRICARAGVSGLWVYDLRRTFASLGLGRGFTLDQLGKALGHSHAATTAGYAWLMPTERKRIAAEIGAEIAGLLPGLLDTAASDRDDREPPDPA